MAIRRTPAAAFASRLPARIGRVFQEFQILLRNEEAAEDFVAAPFEKQRLPRKRPRLRFKAGKRDFHDTSDCCAQLFGKPVDVLRPETGAARVRTRRKQGKVRTFIFCSWASAGPPCQNRHAPIVRNSGAKCSGVEMRV